MQDDFPVAADHTRHPAYLAVVRAVMRTQQASIPRVYRETQCGYGVAARCLDAMEREGLIRRRPGDVLREVLRPLRKQRASRASDG